ncbi:hypothetical protein ACJIZ3_020858 [Penstemon smallii]|uniref:Poly [ADP-ribose] polymerase n=1 Tax=Penstemon smallii TaxID=265156 RepID=A0ABD3SJU4_9LAMI
MDNKIPLLFGDLLQNTDNDENLNSYASDCESGISGTENEQRIHLSHSHNGLIKIHEGEKICEMIKKKFVSSLSCYGFKSQVEALYRKDNSDIMSRVKYQSFGLYSRGIEMKRNGNANVKYAWFGASMDELNSILSHGFGLPQSTGVYGNGVYLSPIDHPVESMQASTPDENGARHMLLCRVILGNTEVIHPGSGHRHNPSSEEFDSGIDNIVSPKKYIIWTGNMNTHILPEFVVTFRATSNCRGFKKISQPRKLPNSDWVPFATLINDLAKFLPPSSIKMISNNHTDYKKQKMTRNEMIQRVRQIAGDKLLISIIKSYREKGMGEIEQKKMRILKN